MVSRLPPDTRQEVDLIAGLGPESLLWLSGGGVMAWAVVRSPHLPVTARVALVVVILAAAALLTWGRYPLSDGGDRLTVWIGRAVRYLLSDRTPRRPYLPLKPTGLGARPTPPRARRLAVRSPSSPKEGVVHAASSVRS